MSGNNCGLMPFFDRVVVEPEEVKEVIRGGLVIPPSDDKPVRGVVQAVGQGKVTQSGELRPVCVKPGDRVMYSKYAGTEYETESGKKYLVLREDDLVGAITE